MFLNSTFFFHEPKMYFIHLHVVYSTTNCEKDSKTVNCFNKKEGFVLTFGAVVIQLIELFLEISDDNIISSSCDLKARHISSLLGLKNQSKDKSG